MTEVNGTWFVHFSILYIVCALHQSNLGHFYWIIQMQYNDVVEKAFPTNTFDSGETSKYIVLYTTGNLCHVGQRVIDNSIATDGAATLK